MLTRRTIMGKGLSWLPTVTGIAILSLSAASTSLAGTVEITYENTATSHKNAGLHELSIDGQTTFAVNTKSARTSPGKTWTATVNSYADVQAGAGKYNRRAGGAKKYNQAGWLFEQMVIADTLSRASRNLNTAISKAIWKIMGKKGRLKGKANSLYTQAVAGNPSIDNYNWSDSMLVFTSTDRKSEFFAPLAPIATPLPSAVFLFGSMLLGLIGILRFNPSSSVMQA